MIMAFPDIKQIIIDGLGRILLVAAILIVAGSFFDLKFLFFFDHLLNGLYEFFSFGL